jgi:type I restriction enzyme S subunit
LFVADFLGNHERFVYYLLKSMNLRRVDSGSAQASINRNFLYPLRVRVPPPDEQRIIARILGTLDDKIELNRRMNHTLEALARALFQSWFVDFDPVVAKAAGRKPVGMNAETARLFPKEFEDSPLGPIPTGWRIGSLGTVAEVIMGTSPSGDTYNEIGVGMPLINGPVEYGDFFPLKRKWTTSPTRLCQADDLIFCVRGSTTGRRVVADDVYCLGRGVCAIRARNGEQGFVDLAGEAGLDGLLTSVTGSTFPNLNGPEIRDFQLVLPPPELLDHYCQQVAPMRKRARENVKQSKTLSTLRDALLPRLLSGELRVKDAEKIAGEAT